jgi:hypothetical protein
VSPTVVVLAIALVALGASNALLDVSMNSQAVVVEARYGRPIMASFHGLFSAGGLAGAAAASAVMARGLGDIAHVASVAAASLVVVGSALPHLVPAGPSAATSVFVRPRGALLALGALAFCGLLAEGAMGDWSAVYLRDALATTPAQAATGFAAFSLAMAGGRFGGDRLVAAFGPALVLRASSVVAAGGLAAALLLGTPLAGVIGCGLVGLGIANVVPVLFSAAGAVPGIPSGVGIAAVATCGYFGLLVGPPVIGLAAEVSSLRIALGIVSALCGVIAVGAGAVRRADANPLAAARAVA